MLMQSRGTLRVLLVDAITLGRLKETGLVLIKEMFFISVYLFELSPFPSFLRTVVDMHKNRLCVMRGADDCVCR